MKNLSEKKYSFLENLRPFFHNSQNMKRIFNAVNQSIINSIIIYPSSYPLLNQFLTVQIPKYKSKYFINQLNCKNNFWLLLIKMNPFMLKKKEYAGKEINMIIQEDDIDQLKIQIINHLLDINQIDINEISLIEKCAFYNSEKCMKFLFDENASITRRSVKINYERYDIGFMEYGAIRGSENIINICLGKGQKIKQETLKLGLISHQNSLVEWMIEEGKRRNHFNENIEIEILGFADNIEFYEKMFNKGININSTDDKERGRIKEELY